MSYRPSRAAQLAARPLHWVVVGPGHFVLHLGVYGQCHIIGAGAAWIVRQHHRIADARPVMRMLVTTLDEACDASERLAAALDVAPLSDPAAAWSDKPASPPQRDALAKWHVPFCPDITCGKAQDLIAAAIARRTPMSGDHGDDPDTFAATGLDEAEIPPDLIPWPTPAASAGKRDPPTAINSSAPRTSSASSGRSWKTPYDRRGGKAW